MKHLLLISAMFLSSAASAGQLDTKFDSIAAQFARDAAARSIDLAAAPAAVFPYGCDEKLARKRVDMAVGELFTARLLRGGSFKLLERSQLDQVMKEQALGLSGAIDSATAAQVGKLAGARLAILGTVTRVGKAYQISSKLVDSQSAEIISASIVEVPLETFDEEAARYLVLVPEREALGLYLGYSQWPVHTKTIAPITNAQNSAIPPGYTVTPKNTSTLFYTITVGLRYQIAKKWLVDLAVAPAANLGTAIKYDLTGAASPPAGTMDGMGGRLSVNRTSDLSQRWRAIYGLGYQAYGISYFSDGTGEVQFGSTGKSINPPSGQANIFGAFARGGLEFKIKNRFNWSLFGQLNQPHTVNCDMEIHSGPTTIGTVRIMELDMPVFVIDTAFAFYF